MATSADGRGRLLKRLAAAGQDLLTGLHALLVVAYFALRWLGGADLWFVDSLGYVLPWFFLPLLLLLPAALFRRSRVLLAVVSVPVALFCITYGHLYLPAWPVRAEGPAFTAMSYNVLYLNEDVDAVAGEIEAQGADFFALRELRPAMAQALEGRLAQRYPYHEVAHGCGFWSRHPILDYAAFQLVDGESNWAQQLVLDVEGRPLNVLSVHPRSPPLRYGGAIGLPVGFDTCGRDADLRALLARLEEVDGPLVLIGDFNMTDQQVLYGSLTHRLDDAHREVGWGMGFTFTHWRDVGLSSWRIDYVFYSPDLVALSAGVGDYGGSDHRPVIARLAFR